jgi:RND family efflux transporter MFP subunit
MKKTTTIFLFGLLLSLFSCGEDKISPGVFEKSVTENKTFEHVFDLKPEKILETFEAVGTVRPLTQTKIEAQINAQILKVYVNPGTSVEKGADLIQLDARNEETQLKKAKEGLAFAKNNLKQAMKSKESSKAGLDQASGEFKRSTKLYKSGVIASQQYEIDQAKFLKAKAMLEYATESVSAAKTGIRQAEQVINEAQVILGYSRIKAPANGVIVNRLADPGDLAVPGKPLLLLQTSGSLRLEASVREGLISRVRQGETYDVKIETIGKTVPAIVEEIVPYADPNTRTFLVKAALPKIPGLYPGMFGRMLIPVKEEQSILIPKEAIKVVGQLEMVNIKSKEDKWESVYIKTGKHFGNKIEVLSGLIGNETLGY